jgi:hypothetical protein
MRRRFYDSHRVYTPTEVDASLPHAPPLAPRHRLLGHLGAWAVGLVGALVLLWVLGGRPREPVPMSPQEREIVALAEALCRSQLVVPLTQPLTSDEQQALATCREKTSAWLRRWSAAAGREGQ